MEGNKKAALLLMSALAAIATGFFCYAKSACAGSTSIIISEILVNGPDGKEFIELYNPTDDIVDMSGWVLNYYSKDRDWANPYRKKFFPDNSILDPDEFFLISTKAGDYLEESDWNLNYSSYQLGNTDGAIAVFPDENFSEQTAIDALGWGAAKVRAFDGLSVSSGKSLERIELSDVNNINNWQESCSEGGTPWDFPEICESPADSSGSSNPTESDGNIVSSEGLYLNEIFANPDGGSDGEYIEIANGGNDQADLIGWMIRDASKTGKYIFKERQPIEPDEYFTIYRPESKLALNNSNESVFLYDPQGNIVSSISYGISPKNASLNFDGKKWRWSKFLTPGGKNEFDSLPKVTIKKIKRAWKDFYATFSAKAKDKETKKLKYVWDFGDGKKSYLENPAHKYIATGKYTVTLSVSDESQTVEKRFRIEVKNYPRPDLEIVKIIPNPSGNDSEGETIELKNNSGKKIDLAGWKIASGSNGKIYNHPIIGEFVLEVDEAKTITREFSKFSLNNKAGTVQLIMPDGNIADEVEYQKEKIADDEAYVKIDGEWRWLGINSILDEEVIDEPASNASRSDTGGEVLGATDIFSARYRPGFTSEDAYIFLSQINFAKKIDKEMSYRSATNPSSIFAYLLASLI